MKYVVIGNANTLKGHKLGSYIDSCDVVVRINFGYMPGCLDEDRGYKTSVIYHCSTARKRLVPPEGVKLRGINHHFRCELAVLYGAQPTSGVMAAIDYANIIKWPCDSLFICGISFFEQRYIENYKHPQDVLEASRLKTLFNQSKIHTHTADRSAFELCLLNKPGVILDPYLTNTLNLPAGHPNAFSHVKTCHGTSHIHAPSPIHPMACLK